MKTEPRFVGKLARERERLKEGEGEEDKACVWKIEGMNISNKVIILRS
jgi:hypothetical protein